MKTAYNFRRGKTSTFCKKNAVSRSAKSHLSGYDTCSVCSKDVNKLAYDK